MNGTEWTEPGQGATAKDLYEAICLAFGGTSPTGATTASLNAIAKIAGGGLVPRFWANRTNLRLTGEPLTAEDLKRIAEAK